ncbi:hypothetical protein D9M71_221670 [compost metagenome]
MLESPVYVIALKLLAQVSRGVGAVGASVGDENVEGEVRARALCRLGAWVVR